MATTNTTEITPESMRIECSTVAQVVHDFLAKHPEQYHQSTWHGENECGTVACVAGWVGILHDDPHNHLDILKREIGGVSKQTMLDLQFDWEARQAMRLGIDILGACLLYTSPSPRD